jgi:glycerol-3-phosphate O-acyltransferase
VAPTPLLDARGRPVDPLSYVLGEDGEPALDPARDAQYTRELGEALARSYARNVVVLSTHLVAAAAFARLRSAFPREDLFAALRHRDEAKVTRAELVSDVDALREKAKGLEDQGRLVLGPGVREKSPATLWTRAVRAGTATQLPVLAQEADATRWPTQPALTTEPLRRRAAYKVGARARRREGGMTARAASPRTIGVMGGGRWGLRCERP